MASILVIDDDDSILTSIRTALKMEDHEIRTATDGESALEQFHQTSFDLVIADLHLPGKSGLEVIQELRQKNPDLKIIALSAHQELSSAPGKGADQTIPKPINILEFVKTVNMMLGKFS